MNIAFRVLASTLLLAACTKHHQSPNVPPNPTFQSVLPGTWTIHTVTTIAYDSTGAMLPNGEKVYNEAPGASFQFNTDGTWVESLSANMTTAGRGTWSFTSDSTFTLSYPTASPVPCKALSWDNSTLVFSHQVTKVFHTLSGPIAGYMVYIFDLRK